LEHKEDKEYNEAKYKQMNASRKAREVFRVSSNINQSIFFFARSGSHPLSTQLIPKENRKTSYSKKCYVDAGSNGY
jgi:hypothetical protein